MCLLVCWLVRRVCCGGRDARQGTAGVCKAEACPCPLELPFPPHSHPLQIGGTVEMHLLTQRLPVFWKQREMRFYPVGLGQRLRLVPGSAPFLHPPFPSPLLWHREPARRSGARGKARSRAWAGPPPSTAGLVLCAAHLPVPPALRPAGLHAVVSSPCALLRFAGRGAVHCTQRWCCKRAAKIG